MARPSSLDVVVILWDHKKHMPPAGCPIEPINVNTGMTSRLPNGRTHLLVYRDDTREYIVTVSSMRVGQ